MSRLLKRIAIVTIFSTAFAMGSATQVSAGHGTPCCTYKTVITYQYVRKACISYITKFDHCGKPYRVRVVTYRTVKIAVPKLVKVCY